VYRSQGRWSVFHSQGCCWVSHNQVRWVRADWNASVEFLRVQVRDSVIVIVFAIVR